MDEGCQILVVQLTYLANWEDIKDEICSSNVVQRSSLVFAKKLDRNLADFATEMENEVQAFAYYLLGYNSFSRQRTLRIYGQCKLDVLFCSTFLTNGL